MTLVQELCIYFKLPHVNFLKETLYGWYDLYQSDHIVKVNLDGSINFCDKLYSAEYKAIDFLKEVEEKYKSVYTKLKDISNRCHSISKELERITKGFVNNGYSGTSAKLLYYVIEAQKDTLAASASTCNEIANYYSPYNY